MEIPDPIKKSLEDIGGLEGLAASLPPEERIEKLAKMFQAISDPLRIRILFILKSQSLCVCLIKEMTSVPDSKLSYHLGILGDAGLICGRQEGN